VSIPHRLKGGGFGLRLKAGSVRRLADMAASQVTLKLSSGSGGAWFLQSQTVWPPRLYASIQPIYTGSAAIQPLKGVGFPDPLSGTLRKGRLRLRIEASRALGRT
jgi:hypothetical protein